MIKQILLNPEKEIEGGVRLKIAELKPVKGHDQISHKARLVEIGGKEEEGIQCMIMKEAMEKSMIRQQVQGKPSVITKGDYISFKHYKIKMNFGTQTIVLKRPFQLEVNSRQKTEIKIHSTYNNIDPNVFDST